MNITMRQLRAFLAVADLGSFTRGAERLNLAQSGASMLVRELEAALGLKLFDRTTRRIELTEAGAEFHQAAAALVGGLDGAIVQVQQLAQHKRGRVSVVASPFLTAALLPAVVADFERRHPAIRVTILEAEAADVARRVNGGDADLGIGTVGAEEGIVAEPILEDVLLLFCRPDHPLAGSTPLPWATLLDHRLVTLTPASSVRAVQDYGLAAAGLSLKPHYEVAHVTTAIGLVAAGLGAGVLPAYAAATGRLHGLVGRVLVEPTIRREISVILRAGRAPTPAAAAFLEGLRAYAGTIVPGGG